MFQRVVLGSEEEDKTVQKKASPNATGLQDHPQKSASNHVFQKKEAPQGQYRHAVGDSKNIFQRVVLGSKEEDKTVQKKANPNTTGLPDNLKSGIENLSGYAMDDVKVHRNSAKPAQLNAHAYAQGTDIHLASGQEQHLPHEAWHVAQQKQGRVQPTVQKKGINSNDDDSLEREADVMGAKALAASGSKSEEESTIQQKAANGVVQKKGKEKITGKEDCSECDMALEKYGNLSSENAVTASSTQKTFFGEIGNGLYEAYVSGELEGESLKDVWESTKQVVDILTSSANYKEVEKGFIELGKIIVDSFPDITGGDEMGHSLVNVTIVGGNGNDNEAPKPNPEAAQKMVDMTDIEDAQYLTTIPNSKSKPTQNEQINANKNTGKSITGGTARSNAKDKVAKNTNRAILESIKLVQSESDSIIKVYIRAIGADGKPSSTVTKKVHRYTNKGRELSSWEK